MHLALEMTARSTECRTTRTDMATLSSTVHTRKEHPPSIRRTSTEPKKHGADYNLAQHGLLILPARLQLIV
jgi:hypothetical protein